MSATATTATAPAIDSLPERAGYIPPVVTFGWTELRFGELVGMDGEDLGLSGVRLRGNLASVSGTEHLAGKAGAVRDDLPGRWTARDIHGTLWVLLSPVERAWDDVEESEGEDSRAWEALNVAALTLRGEYRGRGVYAFPTPTGEKWTFWDGEWRHHPAGAGEEGVVGGPPVCMYCGAENPQATSTEVTPCPECGRGIVVLGGDTPWDLALARAWAYVQNHALDGQVWMQASPVEGEEGRLRATLYYQPWDCQGAEDLILFVDEAVDGEDLRDATADVKAAAMLAADTVAKAAVWVNSVGGAVRLGRPGADAPVGVKS